MRTPRMPVRHKHQERRDGKNAAPVDPMRQEEVDVRHDSPPLPPPRRLELRGEGYSDWSLIIPGVT